MADLPAPLARREAIELAITKLGDVQRLRILIACAAKPMSATDVSDRKTLGRNAYHFRTLVKAGLLRQTREQQRRGAIQKWYTATAEGRRLLAQLGLYEDGHAGA